jgi:alpha-beta hydrolase superfamily lysophospholipase
MKHIEGNFTGVRNIKIFHQAWLPEGNVNAVLFIVHGLGEHSGRYMNVVNRFIPLGYAVYALDHIGHGKSGGARKHIERIGDYTGTLTTYYAMVKDRQPGKPVFLLGHSMGGLIATDYLIDHQAFFKGAVISAPPLTDNEGVSPAVIAMGKALAVLAPKAGMLSLDPRFISRDPAVVDAYIHDDLVCLGKASARLAAELLKTILRVHAEAGKITLPFIALQGTADAIVRPGGARWLFDRAGSKDKTVKIYAGLYHEVFNEPERARVLDDVESWLAAHA